MAVREPSKNMNITLIGMPGVGKSVIGRELAARLGFRFVDVDEIIENRSGLKLQEIIDKFGDDKFVELEGEAILGLDKLDNCIVAPGGSVIYAPDAMEFLKENSLIVFLNASLKTIQKRLSNLDVRGIVGLKKKGLKALFDERLALYSRYAGLTIEIPDDSDVDSIIRAIMARMAIGEK
jgi:shikimate kinase